MGAKPTEPNTRGASPISALQRKDMPRLVVYPAASSLDSPDARGYETSLAHDIEHEVTVVRESQRAFKLPRQPMLQNGFPIYIHPSWPPYTAYNIVKNVVLESRALVQPLSLSMSQWRLASGQDCQS